MKYILTIVMLVCSMSAISQTYSKDLEKAAKDGDIAAQRDLGICFLYGNGTKMNYDKAYEWLIRAAVNNDGTAQYHLGVMCEESYVQKVKAFDNRPSPEKDICSKIGCEPDVDGRNYHTIYMQAYKNGSKDAPRKVSEYYKKMDMPGYAMIWLKRAAETGDKDSQFEYAKMLYAGVNTGNSPMNMIVKELILPIKESYSKGAISKDKIDSMFTEEGFKSTFPPMKDNVEIMQIFLSAKDFVECDVQDSNDVFSFWKMEAKKWFEKAAAQGHVEAKDYLERLVADGF